MNTCNHVGFMFHCASVKVVISYCEILYKSQPKIRTALRELVVKWHRFLEYKLTVLACVHISYIQHHNTRMDEYRYSCRRPTAVGVLPFDIIAYKYSCNFDTNRILRCLQGGDWQPAWDLSMSYLTTASLCRLSTSCLSHGFKQQCAEKSCLGCLISHWGRASSFLVTT